MHVLSCALVERLIGFSYVQICAFFPRWTATQHRSASACLFVLFQKHQQHGGHCCFGVDLPFLGLLDSFFYIFNGDPVWAATCFKGTPDVLFLLFFVTVFGRNISAHCFRDLMTPRLCCSRWCESKSRYWSVKLTRGFFQIQ